jgi:hypothetical protein
VLVKHHRAFIKSLALRNVRHADPPAPHRPPPPSLRPWRGRPLRTSRWQIVGLSGAFDGVSRELTGA